jgi:hypothetical protein
MQHGNRNVQFTKWATLEISPAFTEPEGRFEAVASSVAAKDCGKGILVQIHRPSYFVRNCYTALSALSLVGRAAQLFLHRAKKYLKSALSHHTRNSPHLGPILRHTNSVHTLKPRSFKVHFIIILIPKSRSPTWSVPFSFLWSKFLLNFLPPPVHFAIENYYR